MTVVVAGNFNPRIFHPSWFAANNLLRHEEAEAAIAESEGERQECVVAPDLTVFNAGWLDLQVTQDRFLALSSDPSHYNALRDLVLGVFRLLEHTPIHQMGVNTHFHYKMQSVDDWNAFGDFLVPKAPWVSLVDRPGMAGVSILGPKPGSPDVRCTIRVEPSKRVVQGVFIDTNEHHAPTGGEVSRQLMTILENDWQSAHDHATRVADRLFESFYASR